MTKVIPLHGKYGQGKVALVDDADFNELSQQKWYVSPQGYAYCHLAEFRRGGKPIFMHTTVAQVAPGFDTDHVNGDKLDNRRANLRQATRSQNNQNSRPRIGGLSDYKGVGFHRRSGYWYADIRANSKNKRIGYFETERQAAVAYNQEAAKLFGEFACLNEIPDGDGPDTVTSRVKRVPKSKYIGVYWDKTRQLWVAEFKHHKRKYYAGRFQTEEEAARARDLVAAKVGDDHVKLNFP